MESERGSERWNDGPGWGESLGEPKILPNRPPQDDKLDPGKLPLYVGIIFAIVIVGNLIPNEWLAGLFPG